MHHGSSTSRATLPRRSRAFSRGMGFPARWHPHQAAMLLGRAKLIEPDKASIREALGRAFHVRPDRSGSARVRQGRADRAGERLRAPLASQVLFYRSARGPSGT